MPPGATPADYDLDLTRLLIESAPGVLQRMIDLGIRFTGPHPEPPHSVPRMHNAAPGSMAYIDALRLEAERAGVDIRIGARIVELASNSAGRVTGAVLEDTGTGKRTLLHVSRAVVLATGYYSANDDLARRYGRPAEMEGIGTLPEDATGDGMVAAMGRGWYGRGFVPQFQDAQATLCPAGAPPVRRGGRPGRLRGPQVRQRARQPGGCGRPAAGRRAVHRVRLTACRQDRGRRGGLGPGTERLA